MSGDLVDTGLPLGGALLGPVDTSLLPAVLDGLLEAIVIVRDGVCVYANGHARALFGADPVGEPATAMVAGWPALVAPTVVLEGMVRRDPEPLPVQIRVHAVGDTDDPLLVASIREARDIQAARAAEVARMQAEARYRELVEQIPVVVYADEGGEATTYVSPQIEIVLGVSPEAYLADGDMWMRMIHPDDRARVQEQSDAFIAGAGGDLDDYRMIRPDGRVVWIRDRAFAVRDDRGKVLWEHGILFDVTELKDAEARIAHMAYHDALTGLANRAAFEDALSLAIGRARRSDLWVAVLFLDLDEFKAVNDTLGHHAGDQLLRQFADRLRGCTRETDLVARQGGDEFLLLLADLDPDEAVGAANRVADRVEAALRDPFSLRAGPVRVRGSVGISLFPGDAGDETTLMQHADAAMYRAKRSARGGHLFWTDEDTVRAGA